MAASSFSHHVFLSFRGEDTRETFTGHLYNALDQRGINTFIDDEGLRIGDEISPCLLRAIEESRIAIIIFSKNYANSTWCLDELVKIIQCKKDKGQVVCSVFYKVIPSDVRHQRGSYEEAFAMLEERFKDNKEKVQKWRLALTEATNVSGWHFSNGYECKFIQRIVDEVSRNISRIPLNVARYPIGLQARVSDVSSLLELDCDDVRMVGIYGIGGIGKTTIAKAVYNKVYDQFQYASFLANVRENASHRAGSVKLQERLLFEILGEKSIKLGNTDRGINIIKDRLCRKRVLLVLDNVDDVEQLQELAGGTDWFGPGSRIIITTRDKHLLTSHQVHLTYEVKKLNHLEALQLFSWNAFKRSEPNASYLDLSNRAVCYAEGLPLALTILGSDLCGRSTHQWDSALNKYKKTPNRKVQDILRISFDGLEENEKEVFLYIACFFKGEIMAYVTKALNSCNLHPDIGFAVLVDKSLMNVDERGVLSMHDLIQDMGKEIVRQESPLDPGKRSRLWYCEDVLQVLTEGTGTDRIQGIMLSLTEKQEVQLHSQVLKKMKNLRILIVRNAELYGGHVCLPSNLRLLNWEEYPSPCLPDDFLPEKIVMLELRHSHLTLDKPFKKYANLTSLNLSSSEFLIVPDVSGIPNLEQLILEDCTGLVQIHESVGSLDKLVYLGVENCTKLKNLPSVLKLPSLGCIVLNGCSQLEKFPDLLGKMENLRIIEAEETAIQELPPCVINFSSLEVLVLKCCSNLKELPRTNAVLPNLQLLDISGCPKLQLFPENLSCLSTQNCSTMFPELNENSSNSESLLPEPCLDLVSSGNQFPLLENLDLSDCNLSDEGLHVLSCLSNLISLDISRNNFVSLPTCFNRLGSLQKLWMDNCRSLQQVLGIPPYLEHIDATSCTQLNSQSLSLILSQGFHKASKFEVMAPRPRIQMPLDYYSKGGSMSFLIGQEFPRIALCFIFGFGNKRIDFFACEVQISINKQKASNRKQYFLSVSGDLVWLYHQENLMDLNTYLLHEENHVEVSCEIIDASKAEEVTIYCCGVHEYKEVEKQNLKWWTSSSPCNTRMVCNDYRDNIIFSIETNDSRCHYGDNNLGNTCFSLPEDLRFPEISDSQMRQLSASINQEILGGNGCVAEKKRKTTDIIIHHSKEMCSLHPQPYGDTIWDPMLLECQLPPMNAKQLLPNDCNTSEKKEVGPTLAVARVHPTKSGTKAYENSVLKEDSESHKIIMKANDVHAEPHGKKHEAPSFATNLVRNMGDLHAHRRSLSQSINSKFYVDNTRHQAEADSMAAFYAVLHAENIYAPPSPIELGLGTRNYSKLAYSQETKKALEVLKELLSKQFCHFLEPTSSSSISSNLEYLCTLFEDDDDVSLSLKSILLQISAFTQWGWDYNNASMRLESTTAGLSKLQKLEEGLLANKNQFSGFESIENEMDNQLVYLEERMKELEEQINAIKINISLSAMTRDTAVRKKRETFEAGKVLKAQRDELRKQSLHFRAEQESAKATKAYIEDEWSKVREVFDRILNILG